jgi:hypothetical protein
LLQSCAETGLGESRYRGIHGRLFVRRLESGRSDANLLNLNSPGGIQGLRYAPNARAAMHAIDAQYELCHDVLLVVLMILALKRCSPQEVDPNGFGWLRKC